MGSGTEKNERIQTEVRGKGTDSMIHVVKRDGEIADFSLNKIQEAIKKAFKAT